VREPRPHPERKALVLHPTVKATALVERVVHRADIVKIDGKSYRLRESEADANSRRASRRQKKPSNTT
jgi:hypothetical protein